MPRALKNLDITLGLAVIPVQLFTATSSQGVAFHLLHAKCGSRIQMRLECPVHGIVPREETVKGYETAKDEYVRFEPEELKATLRQGLRLTFADDPSVEVVLDRRGAEPPVPADEVISHRRLPLSHEQDVMWRDLKFFLVDRWKGMTVTKPASLKIRLGETASQSSLDH